MSEDRRIYILMIRFICGFLSFFLRCHGSLGRQRKQQAGFQGDVLTGIAELEKMFDGSLPSKNGQNCPAVSAAWTFLVAQNITLQLARVYFVPLIPLARIFLLEIEDEGESTMLPPWQPWSPNADLYVSHVSHVFCPEEKFFGRWRLMWCTSPSVSCLHRWFESATSGFRMCHAIEIRSKDI